MPEHPNPSRRLGWLRLPRWHVSDCRHLGACRYVGIVRGLVGDPDRLPDRLRLLEHAKHELGEVRA